MEKDICVYCEEYKEVTTPSDLSRWLPGLFNPESVVPLSIFYPQRFILLRIVAITSYVVKELSIIIAYWEQKARGHSSLRLKPRAFWLSKIVIFYLNEKTEKNFKANTKATREKIKARTLEGYTLEDSYLNGIVC